MKMGDIHPKFKPNPKDAKIAKKILGFNINNQEAPQERLRFFEKQSRNLSDYSYWFILSTLWVEYAGFTDLQAWRRLFASNRRYRDCLMKPSEIQSFEDLPLVVKCYRAHRENEADWISYTLYRDVAERFLIKRPNGIIKEYLISKEDILCLFLRRGEYELICLKKEN